MHNGDALKLIKALEFYADANNHDTCLVVGGNSLTKVGCDGGSKARKVLGWKEETKKKEKARLKKGK